MFAIFHFDARAIDRLGGILAGLVLVIIAGTASRTASGQPFYTLLSNNLRLGINLNPSQHKTVYDWVVEDGTILHKDHLEEFSNWFRVGSTPEFPVSALLVQSVNASNPDKLVVTYRHPLFSLEITYGVAGGPIGSGYSQMGECVTIKNLQSTPLDLHFFEYMDLDLDETPNDDTAWRLNANRLEQFDSVTTFNVAYGTSSGHEIAYHPATLNELTNGSASNLNNIPAGFLTPIGPPGNMTWALQWDIPLSPMGSPFGGDTFSICKNCELQMKFNVPEPASAILAAIGAMAMLCARGRRRFGRELSDCTQR